MAQITYNIVQIFKFIFQLNIKRTIFPGQSLYIWRKLPSIENFKYYWTLESQGKQSIGYWNSPLNVGFRLEVTNARYCAFTQDPLIQEESFFSSKCFNFRSIIMNYD